MSYKTFGTFIIHRRVALQIVMREAANKAGLSTTFWSRVECDHELPDLQTAIEMGRVICASETEIRCALGNAIERIKRRRYFDMRNLSGVVGAMETALKKAIEANEQAIPAPFTITWVDDAQEALEALDEFRAKNDLDSLGRPPQSTQTQPKESQEDEDDEKHV